MNDRTYKYNRLTRKFKYLHAQLRAEIDAMKHQSKPERKRDLSARFKQCGEVQS